MVRRRIQGFEFNDAPSMPVVLKESIVETLSRGLEWGGILDGLVEPFAAFLKAAAVHEVLDMCSGAGKPVRILARAIHRKGGEAPQFLLTDLMPHPETWTELQAEMPQTIAFVRSAVDATAIPAELSAGRARLIINALHHFPPQAAEALFADAVRQGAPIFIAECFERGIRHFFPMLPYLVLAHLVNPVLAPQHKVLKVFLNWLTPLGAIAGVWDGLMSTLRVYSEEELRSMVAGFGGHYTWEYGTFTFPLRGKGYYFHGRPAVS